jgi:glycine cleavage system H protein
MAKVQDYDVPDDLLYHEQHMWVRVDGDEAVVGVDDFTQKAAGEVTYIELPEEGDSVEAGDLAGSIETGKWVGKLYSPVSGEIAAANQEAADDPVLVNRDPYGDGWLFKVTMSDRSELEDLMKADAAVAWIQEEIKKHIKK